MIKEPSDVARARPRKLETEDASLSRNLRDITIATSSRVLYLPPPLLDLVGTRYAPTSMTHFLATFASFASICAMARRTGGEGEGGMLEVRGLRRKRLLRALETDCGNLGIRERRNEAALLMLSNVIKTTISIGIVYPVQPSLFLPPSRSFSFPFSLYDLLLRFETSPISVMRCNSVQS